MSISINLFEGGMMILAWLIATLLKFNSGEKGALILVSMTIMVTLVLSIISVPIIFTLMF